MTRAFFLKHPNILKNLSLGIAMATCPLIADQNICGEEAFLAPGHSCVFCQKEKPGTWMISTSFLIWQSKEWGLEFGSKSRLPKDSEPFEETFKEKLFIPDFSWSPGFKVNVGTNLPYDGWDLLSSWTYYHGDFTHLKKHLGMRTDPVGMGIVPLWHYPFFDIDSGSDPLRFHNSAANLKLSINSIDLNLGRQFWPNCNILLRLHSGAKVYWSRQHYHVDYRHGTIVNGILEPSVIAPLEYLSSRMVHNNHAWGLGPRGGIESKWKFGWGFSLVAHTAFSLLSSFFDLSTKFHDELINESNAASLKNDLHLKLHQWNLSPVLEGNFGLDWGHCFGCVENPFYIGLTIAYEVQYWWSQNHASRNFAFTAPGNMWDMRGDLQMHGLTATIRSDF